MRAVIQRTTTATVTVADVIVGQISGGLTVLLGVGKADSMADVTYMAEKIINLRIFEDESGKMNRSLLEVNGDMLVVSQFTLYGDLSKGRRPGFDQAAPPEQANDLYEAFVAAVRVHGITTATGKFRTEMVVSLDNHGPVTLLLDSKKIF